MSDTIPASIDDAYEVVSGARSAPVVVTCEHASQRLPEPWTWHPADGPLVGTHWAYDPGADELARALAARLNAPAVVARFTRLLADPNRSPEDETWMRTEAEGRPVELNRKVDEDEQRRRRQRLWAPYHAAVDQVTASSTAPILLSVHTFTPVYAGEPRYLDVGVLFDRERGLATDLATGIGRRLGVRTALNEPYSGREGLIYAVDRHARRHGRRALEIEVRQDHAVRPEFRRELVEALGVLLQAAPSA